MIFIVVAFGIRISGYAIAEVWVLVAVILSLYPIVAFF